MQIDRPLSLLGGLSPRRFVHEHWQKRPALIRQAWPGVRPPLARAELFALAARDDVESRLVVRREGRWTLRHGPLPRRSLPPLQQPGWTLLVQGVDLHAEAAHQMLQAFAFVPQARLDDLMISYASEGGGVGAHRDSYDVFLLQVHGRRRWRVGRVVDPALVPDMPLRLLANFQPEEEWLLEPGDMLYVPPLWGHDGIAEGECMTCSIGFRAPPRETLAAELLHRIADAQQEGEEGPLYRDPAAAATADPGRVPEALQRFAQAAMQRMLNAPDALAQALGEALTEPKPMVVFEGGGPPLPAGRGVRLDRRTRLMYDDRHLFINGEAFRAGGRDARLMRQLADRRMLGAGEVAQLSREARALVSAWAEQGWLHSGDTR